MNHGQMFPMTEEEQIGLLRKNLQSDVDKRLAKRDTAAVALDDAQEAEDVARGLLAAFDHMVRLVSTGAEISRRAEKERSGPAMEAAVNLKRNAEKAGIGLSFAVNGEEPIVITEAPEVDPITGEVASVPVADWECPTCHGDGRLPDKTGGGHHRCKACDGTGHVAPSCDNCTGYGDCSISQASGSDTMGCGGRSWMHGEVTSKVASPYVSVVVALYPGSDEPVVTEIGEKTRYGELVADYFTAAGLGSKHDAKDWTVVAEDELTTAGGGVRKLRDVITGADYGKRLLVVAADQGSVTGVDEGSGDD